MFKFLFGGARQKVQETQRQTIERALGEVNVLVAELEQKPAVRFDPQTGAISLELPEQMPDETLALPAPAAEDGDANDTPKADDENDAETKTAAA